MRFLSADYLFTLKDEPIKNGVIQVDNSGKIIEIFNDRSLVTSHEIEVFNGIICPGFINSHCHLELSHLKGLANTIKDFSQFISLVKSRYDFSKNKIYEAIQQAESEMFDNGIVAVGDICNTVDTIHQKKNNKLLYYNFIETFEIHDNKADSAIKKSLAIRSEFRSYNMQATITPHAPYSVPPYLMDQILKYSDNSDVLFSIHNQETNQENDLFTNKSGAFYDWLNNIEASSSIWNKRDSSQEAIIAFGLIKKKLLLVHNTYSKKNDLSNNYYCTCPKANLFIEKKLPDYSLFNVDNLCVGTDSLASNDSLSIIKELAVIQQNSNFSLQELLIIGCKNGAEIFGFKNLGTLESGKTPGVNLVSDFKKGLEFANIMRII
jgi:cytosine/adenosine deaminase-related metal-dependent hydrolase